jgi:uncharacterized protein
MKLLKTLDTHYLYDSYSNSIVKIKDDLSEEDFEANKAEIRALFIEKGVFNKPYKPLFQDISLEDLKKSLESELSHLILNTTNQCNLRCKYCSFSGVYTPRRVHNDSIMTEETAFKAVDFFLERTGDSKRVTIGFYGGEPLMNFTLMKKIVEKVNREYKIIRDKVHFALTTNGLLLTSKKIEFLKQNEFSISVSLDGPKDIHDKWRITESNSPSFDIILQNLSEFRNKYPDYFNEKVSFEATVTHPYDLLSRNDFFLTQPVTKGIEARFNYVNELDKIEKEFGMNRDEAEHNTIESLKFLGEKFSNLEFDKIKSLILLWLPIFKRIHYREKLTNSSLLNINGLCLPGVKRLFVNTEGDLFLCERLDYFESIGSVEKGFDFGTLQRILHHYIAGVKKDCPDCWARYFCNLCFVSVADKNEMDMNLKPSYCDALKRRVESGLRLYLRIMEKNPAAFDEFFKNLEEMDELQ